MQLLQSCLSDRPDQYPGTMADCSQLDSKRVCSAATSIHHAARASAVLYKRGASQALSSILSESEGHAGVRFSLRLKWSWVQKHGLVMLGQCKVVTGCTG